MGWSRASLLLACGVLIGCAGRTPRLGSVGGWALRAVRGERATARDDGAAGVVSTDVETVDLTAALVIHCPPERRAVASLDEAYLRFEECADDEVAYRRRRTQVQERLVAASNAQCGAYKRRLRDAGPPVDAPSAGTSLGRAAMAGLGMAAPPVAVAKGLADVVTAVRAPATPAAEHDDDRARRVVSLGIDTRRAVLLQAIRHRQRDGIDAYSVQAAVADALAYHDACSAAGGLDAAADALAHADPGVSETRAVFAREATDTAATAVARTREQLALQRDRLTSLVITAATDAPGERAAAEVALGAADDLAAERARDVTVARRRTRALTERLDDTTDPRFRASLLADLDLEVSRAVRASSEVDDAYAAARAAVDAVAARIAPLRVDPPSR